MRGQPDLRCLAWDTLLRSGWPHGIRMQDDLFTTHVLTDVDDAWSAAIADLDASGIPVPLPSRPEWIRCIGSGSHHVLVTAEDRRGRCRAALALEIAPTRALPGHLIARAHRVGVSTVGIAGDAVLTRLREYAASNSRLLQVNLEFILRTNEQHARIASTLQRLGFRPESAPRHYQESLVIALNRNESEMLKSFSSTTRTELRQWPKRPVDLRPIRQTKYVNRLNDITQETWARTSGRYVPRDWAQRIALCDQLPSKARLVGLFRAERDDPDALLAYAWGCAHGDHANYEDAGSTRVTDINVSLISPLLWDLIVWAKDQHCAWFDMGGTLPDSARQDDPRAGIDRFKRRFSKEAVMVGSEWVYEPHPVRTRLAAGVRAIGSHLFRERTRSP